MDGERGKCYIFEMDILSHGMSCCWIETDKHGAKASERI